MKHRKYRALGLLLLSIAINCAEQSDAPSEQSVGHCRLNPAAIHPWSSFETLEPRPLPYVARHQGCDTKIVYIAARHTANPASKTHQLIKDVFTQYRLEQVVLEGFIHASGTNPQGMIARAHAASNTPDDTEILLAIRLAQKTGTSFTGAEPTDTAIYQAMAQNAYTVHDFFYFYVLRSVDQWHRTGMIDTLTDTRLDTLVRAFPATLSAQMRIHVQNARVDISGDAFLNWYKDTNGIEFMTGYRVQDSFPASKTFQRPTNHLASLFADTRERYMIEVIDKAAQQHKTIAVILGGSHHLVQQPALERAFPELP